MKTGENGDTGKTCKDGKKWPYQGPKLETKKVQVGTG
jgi:hypothetical protein